jgi:type I restriction enzyme S subunit
LIPKGWNIKSLEELAIVERGRFSVRPRNTPIYYGGDIPFVQTGDIASSGGYLKNYTQTLNEKGLAISKLFPENTILMTIAANIGDVALTTFPVACPDSLVGMRARDGIEIHWLFYELQNA